MDQMGVAGQRAIEGSCWRVIVLRARGSVGLDIERSRSRTTDDQFLRGVDFNMFYCLASEVLVL